MSYTVDDLLRQIRAQLQETNTKSVSDQTILDASNRGQDYAFDIMARQYPDPLVSSRTVKTNPDTSLGEVGFNNDNSITIPEGSMSQRIQKLEIKIGSLFYELPRLSYRDITRIDYVSGRPTNYAITGNKVFLYPTGQIQSHTYRMWQIDDIEELVKPQGRVREFVAGGGTANSSVLLDALGSELSASDYYGKYVNIVDSQTGQIKGSLEIASINTDTNEVEFKYTGLSRTTALNKNIDNDLPTDIERDDYLAPLRGTCVLFFKKPLFNFVLQYAVADIRRSLGYDVTIEQQALKRLEDQVEHTWARRESHLRVKRKNSFWYRRQ